MMKRLPHSVSAHAVPACASFSVTRIRPRVSSCCRAAFPGCAAYSLENSGSKVSLRNDEVEVDGGSRWAAGGVGGWGWGVRQMQMAMVGPIDWRWRWRRRRQRGVGSGGGSGGCRAVTSMDLCSPPRHGVGSRCDYGTAVRGPSRQVDHVEQMM